MDVPSPTELADEDDDLGDAANVDVVMVTPGEIVRDTRGKRSMRDKSMWPKTKMKKKNVPVRNFKFRVMHQCRIVNSGKYCKCTCTR